MSVVWRRLQGTLRKVEQPVDMGAQLRLHVSATSLHTKYQVMFKLRIKRIVPLS